MQVIAYEKIREICKYEIVCIIVKYTFACTQMFWFQNFK